MKSFLAIPAALILLAASSATAAQPLKEYASVRGVCYTGWTGDQATLERELGYAKRLQLNSTRIWLSKRDYESDPTRYIDRLRNYVRTANRLGMSTMPILFNGNGLDPKTLQPEFRAKGDTYVKAVVEALNNEPGLFIWDVMNEPTFNDYLIQATPKDRPAREEEINQFVRYYIALVKKFDPRNATTVGHAFVNDLWIGGDLVDVLCFHDYESTRHRIEANYATAQAVAKRYNKPLINSELGCVGRANPYDLAIQVCEQHKVGWYAFELIVHGFWGPIHGLVYPDGTVRDPSIIAALYGFHRNRDEKTMILEQADREGHARKAIKAVEDALTADAASTGPRSTDPLLEASEDAADLLEAAQLVPMRTPPTAKILSWRMKPENQRDPAAIRAFAQDMADLLKKSCDPPAAR